MVCADAMAAHAVDGRAGPEYHDSTTGAHFIQVPAGEFLMGTIALRDAAMEMPSPNPRQIWHEAPQHRVIFEKPFFLGSTEVTQQQWYSIMQTRPGEAARWSRQDWQQLPVTGISWHDAQGYIDELNRQSDQHVYRMPTEAEWEYAARAGTSGLRPFALDSIDKHCWTLNNSGGDIQPVASRRHNAWGLHDMLGNAAEWVSDWYAADSYRHSRMENPAGPETGDRKITRGGSYASSAYQARPGYRSSETPDTASSTTGLRLIIEARPPIPAVDAHH